MPRPFASSEEELVAKLQPNASSALDALDAIIRRHSATGPQGDEFTVDMLRKRGKEGRQLSRAEARTIIERALSAGDIVVVRTLSNNTKIYRKIANAEHHNNDGTKRFGVV